MMIKEPLDEATDGVTVLSAGLAPRRPRTSGNHDAFQKGLESEMKRFGVPERPRMTPSPAGLPSPRSDRRLANARPPSVPCPEDLAMLVAAWPMLSDAVRQGILTLVRAERGDR
jgi:hypothetical protein